MPPFFAWQLELYYPFLHRWARQLHFQKQARGRFDSGDLVQETLLRAYLHRATFKGTTEGALLKWLKKILVHIQIDQVRKAGAGMRDVNLEQPLPNCPEARLPNRLGTFWGRSNSSPLHQVELGELVEYLNLAIEQLPEEQREVVILRYLRQHREAEIAHKLNRSRKSIAGLLHRGRRRLREQLAFLLPD